MERQTILSADVLAILNMDEKKPPQNVVSHAVCHASLPKKDWAPHTEILIRAAVYYTLIHDHNLNKFRNRLNLN